jgi:acyl carrier protein
MQTFFQEVEKRVVEIWALELGCPVAATDDFFKLGGDSIMVLRIMHQMKEAFGREFEPTLLFQNSVAGDFSRVVAEIMQGKSP